MIKFKRSGRTAENHQSFLQVCLQNGYSVSQFQYLAVIVSAFLHSVRKKERQENPRSKIPHLLSAKTMLELYDNKTIPITVYGSKLI